MELADLAQILRARWLSVVACGIAGLVVALVASLATTPIYSARSQVFVSVRGSDSTAELLEGSNFTVRQVKSYTQLATSPMVLTPVIDELGLDETPDDLAQRVEATSPLDTVLIDVTAEDESPEQAASVADAVAASLADVVRELETPAGGGPSPVQLSTVRTAVIPASPASPNTGLNMAIGLVLGLAAGVGLAILRERLDTKVRDNKDVQSISHAPTLGTIGYDETAEKRPLIVQESPQSPRSEAFRRLRTNLQFVSVEESSNAIVITSALPGEGKTTTAINLAITLADAGTRVVLVDADLRRPCVAAYLGIEGAVGLTTFLIGRASEIDVVQPWGNGNLDVIASGQVPPNPSELLASDRMSALVQQLTASYDLVLIDTAPLLPVTDGAILAQLVSGAVVVVAAGAVHKQQLGHAVESLKTVGARVLGTVINRMPARAEAYGGYTYYKYPDSEDHRVRSPRSASVGSHSTQSGPLLERRGDDPFRMRLGETSQKEGPSR